MKRCAVSENLSQERPGRIGSIIDFQGEGLLPEFLPLDAEQGIRDHPLSALGPQLPVRSPPGDLAFYRRHAQSQLDPDLVDSEEMVEVPVEASGGDPRLLGCIPSVITKKPRPPRGEAVDVVLGEIPDPDPEQPGVKKSPKPLVRGPPRPVEVKPRQLARGQEAHLAHCLEDPEVPLGQADAPGAWDRATFSG